MQGLLWHGRKSRMKSRVVFLSESDEWATPQDFFDNLNAEFHFTTDVACTPQNSLCAHSIFSALDTDWSDDGDYSRAVCFMNPPYSQCRAFMAKATEESHKGATVVCLVPSRTDTQWWHKFVWNQATHQFRPGVEGRFVKGRWKFGGAKQGAPFPSVVVIFRPTPSTHFPSQSRSIPVVVLPQGNPQSARES